VRLLLRSLARSLFPTCLAPKHRPLVPSTFPTPARSTLPACLSPSARRPHQSLGLKFHRERENRNFDRARCPALDCPRASTAARGRSGRRDVGTTDTRVITSPLTVQLAMPHVRARATARGGARRKKRGKRNTIERISGESRETARSSATFDEDSRGGATREEDEDGDDLEATRITAVRAVPPFAPERGGSGSEPEEDDQRGKRGWPGAGWVAGVQDAQTRAVK